MKPEERRALTQSLSDALRRANVFDLPRRWRRRFPVPIEALRETPVLVGYYFEPRRLAPEDAIKPRLLKLRVLYREAELSDEERASPAVWFLAEGIEEP